MAEKKINEWSESVEAVAEIAEYFVQRVVIVPNIGHLFTKLEKKNFRNTHLKNIRREEDSTAIKKLGECPYQTRRNCHS